MGLTSHLHNLEYLIGIDVGTTSVKAGLFTLDGTQLSAFSERYETFRAEGGAVTQNPEDWFRLVVKAFRLLTENVPLAAIKGAGLTSQVNTHVFVDQALNPLLPAFVWQDARCADAASVLDAQVSIDDKMGWWGAPLPIDASHVLARMAFVKHNHPDVWTKTKWVLAPKDYCIAKLTGVIVTDPMTSFGIVDSKLEKIEALLSLVKGAGPRLPDIARFAATAGTIKTGLPCAGIPMVTGAMDAWSGFLGAGIANEGDAVYLSGTSEILGLVSNTKVPTPGVIAFPKCENLVVHAGPTQSGAASLDWASKLFNRPIDELLALAGNLDPNVATPLFMPHLDGERAPIWDPHSRGAFAGASALMDASHFTLAILEGVVYSVRLLLDSLEQSAAIEPLMLRHAGGGAKSDLWCQVRADVLGIPVQRLKNLDAGVAGAAMLAGLGAGVFGSIAEAAKAFVQVDRIFTPRNSVQERHDQRFAQYQSLYEQLKFLQNR